MFSLCKDRRTITQSCTLFGEHLRINLTFSAYPNPTIDILTLEVKKSDLSNLNYQLYNIQGKLLQSHKITEPKTNIIMSHLVPSVYFIKVTEGQKEIKTFKIIKN